MSGQDPTYNWFFLAFGAEGGAATGNAGVEKRGAAARAGGAGKAVDFVAVLEAAAATIDVEEVGD